MFENKKRLYIFGCISIGILGILILYFSLIVSGAINLTKNNLVISSESEQMIFNEEELLNHNYTLEYGNIKSTETMEVVFTKSISEIGSVDNEFFIIIRDEDENIVTSKYDIEYIFGTLTISPIPLHFGTSSDYKTYDGTPLTNDSSYLLSGYLLEGHEYDVYVTGELTDVGTIDNDFFVVIVNERNIDVTELYSIQKTLGTLEVIGKRITISSDSDYKQYDGTPLANEGYNYNSDSLLPDHEMTIFTTGTITEIGTTNNTIHCIIRDEWGLDVTSQYIITTNLGTLTIDKKDITIRTGSSEKIYDGTPLTNEKYEVIGLVAGHTELVITTGTVTNVTSNPYINSCSFAAFDMDNNDVTNYYSVTYERGLLQVTPYIVTVYSEDLDFDYTGSPYSSDVYIVSQNTPLFNNDYLEIDYLTYFTIPGEKQNYIGFKVYNDKKENISDNYSIDNQLGYITINGIKLTISTDDVEKEYDGEPLSCDNYNYYGTLLDGHEIVYTNDTSITNVGTKTDFYSVKIIDKNDNDTNVSSYYDIDYTYGKLTVTTKKITITTATLSIPYNSGVISAQTLYNNGYNNLIMENLIGNDKVTNVVFNASAINVGVYDNECTLDIVDEDNVLSKNYSVTLVYSTMTITKAEVTIQTSSNIFEYTGEPVQEESYFVVSGTLYSDAKVSATNFIEVTEVGCYYNTAVIKINNAYSEENENYSLTVLFGNITIYEDDYPIVLSPINDSIYISDFNYNNYNHDLGLNGFDYFSKVEGYYYEYEVELSGTSSPYTLTIINIDIFDKDGTNKNNKFEVQLTEGTLIVYDTTISLSSENFIKEYDGTTIYASSYKSNISVTGLPAGWTCSYDLDTQRTDAGLSKISYSNIIIRNASNIDVTNSCKIIDDLGYLEITKVTVNVELKNVEVNTVTQASSIVLSYTSDIDSKFVLDVVNISTGVVTMYDMVFLEVSCSVYFNGNDITKNFNIVSSEAVARYVE